MTPSDPVHRWRWRLWRRPLLALAAFGVAMSLPLPVPRNSRLVLAYTLGMAAYAAALLHIMARPRREEMMAYADRHASKSWLPLVASGLLSVAGLAMLVFLVSTGGTGSPAQRAVHVFVSLVAMLLTWLVMNGVFTLRYAALYYEPTPGAPDRPRGGLRFPDADLVPDYWDFLYYAVTIGMCYQTSDVALSSPEMRRQTLLHGIFAFLYVAGIFSMMFGTVGNFL